MAKSVIQDNCYKNYNSYTIIFFFRRNTELTAESIKHLEKVFRENLAKDKDEFTLSEFKRIVPSKNVSWREWTAWKTMTYVR